VLSVCRGVYICVGDEGRSRSGTKGILSCMHIIHVMSGIKGGRGKGTAQHRESVCMVMSLCISSVLLYTRTAHAHVHVCK